MRYRTWIIGRTLIGLCILASVVDAAELQGTIKGLILDNDTQRPLVGANVLVIGHSLGGIAGEDGRFTTGNVPAGVHSVQVSMIGYEIVIRTDIVVRPNRITTIEVDLAQQAVDVGETVVTADYFVDAEEEVVSSTVFSYEEIRRSPGSAGDISRLLQALPAVNMATDSRNDLVVRGGSPAENLVLVDNIEVPNINHFPTQGASGGPIGLLNTDLIADVRFSAGGFSAAHGDKLSSVIDVDLREGNRDELDVEANMGMAGAGLIAEGPLAGGRGSWVLSARRSYLDLIVDAIGTGAVPKYSDVQGKGTYDVTDEHQLSVLGIGGFDTIDIKPDDSDEDDNFTDVAIDQQVLGANWRWLWSAKGYANTSVAFSRGSFGLDVTDGDSGVVIFGNDSQEKELVLRSNFHYRAGTATELDWGLVTRRLFSDYVLFAKTDTNRVGQTTDEVRVGEGVEATKVGLFASVGQRLTPRLRLTAGLRFDYFDLNEEYDLAPRLGLTYDIDDRTSISAATGIYYQNLSPLLVVQHADNGQLENPRADHYVVGLRRRLTPSVLLTIEGYLKNYTQLPFDPDDPTESLIDSYATYGTPTPGRIVGGGEATSHGFEVLLQKKMATNLYGTGSYSYSVSKYTDLGGTERNRSFDNRHLFSVILGYRPSDRLEYSLRWAFAGGRPRTPFDVEQSRQLGTGIIDSGRVNSERHAVYHRLDLRVDHRKYFSRFNLVSVFSLLNAYNRANVFAYYWDDDSETVERIDQWAFLPIGGFELEF
ncbi:MAG: TonB-dependent receptor [Candidatus Latescibacteria bacterium]|jgi:hypothetical protein|nr:TonB-dependent receptor [Candidatus Latescibacterota bacterium]